MITFDNLWLLRANCEQLGLPVPTLVDRAIEMRIVAADHNLLPTGPLLGLSDDEVRERVTAISIREHQGHHSSTRGMITGIEEFNQQLLLEVSEALRPEFDELVAALQPKFAEVSAAFVTAAQKYHITSRTTPADVLDMADEGASAAMRGSKEAFAAIQPIARFRTFLSRTFEVAPTRQDLHPFDFLIDETAPVDFSVCFAAGLNFSTDGSYYTSKTGHDRMHQIDWFALAVGGLRLNTPTEVLEKIRSKRVARDLPVRVEA